MPCFGHWGASGAVYWWVLPLFGLVFMGIMFFVCARGSGCGGGRRRAAGDGLSHLESEVARLKEEVRKLERPR